MSLIAQRLGCSEKDLIQLADRHTCTVQAWLASRSPEAVHYHNGTFTASSTGYGVAILNAAFGITHDVDIENVTRLFQSRHVPAFWWVSPAASGVEDFGAKLEKFGWMFDRPPLPAMIADAQAFEPLPVPDTLRVWRAETHNDLTLASTIRRIAFRFPEGEAVNYFERMPESWLDNPDATLYLVAEGEAAPTAIGALVMGEGIPGVYVIATLPDQRRRGLGKAVMNAIMNQAKAAGHHTIVLTASTSGYGLYQQCGFEHIFDYALYRLTKA